MKEKYEAPELEVIDLDEDIITTSGGTGLPDDSCPGNTGGSTYPIEPPVPTVPTVT